MTLTEFLKSKNLTAEQITVVKCVNEGVDYMFIAQRLGMSHGAIKARLATAMKYLEVSGTTELRKLLREYK